MRQEFTIENGQKFWIEVIKGTVVDQSSADIAVTNQGADRMVIQPGGQVRTVAGRVSTEIVTKVKIWLKLEDGREGQFDISSVPLAVRPGHVVRFVRGAPARISSSEEAKYLAAENMTTGEQRVREIDYQESTNYWKLKAPWFLKAVMVSLVLGLIAWPLAWLFMHSGSPWGFFEFWGFSFFAIVPYMFYQLVKTRHEFKVPYSQVLAHGTNLMKS